MIVVDGMERREATHCEAKYETNTVAAFCIARRASFWMVVLGGKTDLARRWVRERGRRWS